MVASLVMSQVSSTCRADEHLRFLWRLLVRREGLTGTRVGVR
jgi:hypothetical protein